MAPEVERQRETAVDVGQTVGKALADLGQQEIVPRDAPGRPVAMPPDGKAVEQKRDRTGRSHGPEHRALPVGLTGQSPASTIAGMDVSLAVPRWARRLGRAALDAVLPPRCLGCGETVDEPGSLCGACWSKVSFIAPPLCDRCGRPFELPSEPGAVCAPCIADPPPWRRARAVFRYDEATRPLITGFKFRDQTHAAPAFGRWMARAGGALLDEADVIAPVPLHWLRLFARRYNQAALLAQALARESGVPVIPDLLVRRRRTPPQTELGRAARQRNVAGAFALRQGGRDRIRNRRILLVDDVLTTGATVAACAELLNREGAESVDVLTVARVVSGA
jgi:ComF family protein